MYIIIELQWHQYIVKQWDVLTVDRISTLEVGNKLEIDKIIAIFDDDWNEFALWTPYLEKYTLEATSLENKRWKKMDVLKFKRKNRYERHIWFRPDQTVLQIENLKS